METHGVQLPPEMEWQNVDLMELYMAKEKEPYISQRACNAFDFPNELLALGQKEEKKKKEEERRKDAKVSYLCVPPGLWGCMLHKARCWHSYELFHPQCFTCEEMESES